MTAVRRPTGSDAPRRQTTDNPDHLTPRIEENNVDRKAHTEGVDGPAPGEGERPAIGRPAPEREASGALLERPGNDNLHRRDECRAGLHSSP